MKVQTKQRERIAENLRRFLGKRLPLEPPVEETFEGFLPVYHFHGSVHAKEN